MLLLVLFWEQSLSEPRQGIGPKEQLDFQCHVPAHRMIYFLYSMSILCLSLVGMILRGVNWVKRHPSIGAVKSGQHEHSSSFRQVWLDYLCWVIITLEAQLSFKKLLSLIIDLGMPFVILQSSRQQSLRSFQLAIQAGAGWLLQIYLPSWALHGILQRQDKGITS